MCESAEHHVRRLDSSHISGLPNAGLLPILGGGLDLEVHISVWPSIWSHTLHEELFIFLVYVMSIHQEKLIQAKLW